MVCIEEELHCTLCSFGRIQRVTSSLDLVRLTASELLFNSIESFRKYLYLLSTVLGDWKGRVVAWLIKVALDAVVR